MTPGHPEGCFKTSTSLTPCVTNKAKLPPHSLMNRHQSCAAKGRWEARRETANRDGKNSLLSVRGRNTRVCHCDTPSWTAEDSGGNSWSPSLKEEPLNCWEKPNMSAKDQVLVFRQRATPPNETNAAISLIPEKPAVLPALAPTTSDTALWRFSSLTPVRLTGAASPSANSSKRLRRFTMRRSGSWFLTDNRGHSRAEPTGTSACSSTLTHHQSPFVDGLSADAINTQVLRTVLSKWT